MEEPAKALIEVYTESQGWTAAAQVCSLVSNTKGALSPSSFEYLIDFAADPEMAQYPVSLCYPVDFEQHRLSTWPAFLFDLIPSGAARRFWMKKLHLGEGPHADWSILLHGAFNPPGRVRVSKQSDESLINHNPDGFTWNDVVNRTPEFLYYIEEFGGPVKGATGAGGDAPKYLLRQDQRKRLHADLALPDTSTEQCWLVKYPRGNRTHRDIEVLKGEHFYHSLARRLQFKSMQTGTKLVELDSAQALFVPRMDRLSGETMGYFGLESLYSVAGICDWPLNERQWKLSTALLQKSSDPFCDFVEYVQRDLANMIFGNTDNHGRNSALLLRAGSANLSPVYDFAPMALDPEGTTRTVRWKKERSGRIRFKELMSECEDILTVNGFGERKGELQESLITFLLRAQQGMHELIDLSHGTKHLADWLLSKGLPFLKTLNEEIKKA